MAAAALAYQNRGISNNRQHQYGESGEVTWRRENDRKREKRGCEISAKSAAYQRSEIMAAWRKQNENEISRIGGAQRKWRRQQANII
jgi:hypothetical protein